jgi:selenocysteine lyase/cysteine desulfurase
VAHAHGAYVYADIIQGAGAIPIDVKALGIDCAACGTYKWLGGDRGFGFLYVREDLQDSVVKRSRYGATQFSNPNNAQADSQFKLMPGAFMYESSNVVAEACGAATHASLKYIHQLGIHNIRAHAKPLIDLLQKEMPRLGYPPITAPDTPTSVVSFLAPDYAGMNAKLKKAFGHSVVAPRRWEFTRPSGEAYVIEGVRISPSIYNNENDINRLLEALA